MHTKSYTSNIVFENNQINAICDELLLNLVTEFPPVDPDENNDFVYQHFILSGLGASVMQVPSAAQLKNIIFQCDSEEIYNWLALNYQKIFNGKGMIFKERIVFYPLGYFFEIWFSATALTPVLSNRIYVQNEANIPLILK